MVETKVEDTSCNDRLEIEVVAEPGVVPPDYATPGSAGMDLRAAKSVEIGPMERVAVPTGLRLAIPPGYEGQVRARSGLALRQGLVVANGPGTVDSDYRGEVAVILINLGTEKVTIQAGERIAQLVIAPVVTARWRQVDALPETDRSDGGFGSTGLA